MYQASKRTHVTLPSVEGVSILRDPPRGVFTQRRTRVGDDNSLVTTVDGSGDRIAENINVYARGVNPMVEVSYSNTASNGMGQGGTAQGSSGRQAYLPYRIMDGGAYRAPVIAPTSLLPLSRMPRVHTFADTNKAMVDFSKLITCGTNQRNTKKEVLTANVTTAKSRVRDEVREMPVDRQVKDSLTYACVSNPRAEYTRIDIENNVERERRRPVTSGYTIPSMKMEPVLENPETAVCTQNRPNGYGYTNMSGPGHSVQAHNPETTVIKRNLSMSAYESRPSMPMIAQENQIVRTCVSKLKPVMRH